MAKIRTIKPSTTTDDKLAEVSRDAELLFILSLMFVDDAGRMEYSPKSLKMKVFPSERDWNLDINPLVSELCDCGLFVLYEVEGRKHLCIPNFLKHQKISKPTPSTLEGPNSSTCSNIKNPLAIGKTILNEEYSVVTGKSGEELEGGGVVGSEYLGRGSGIEPAPDLSSLQLARGLAENIGLPTARGNLEAISHSIDAEAKNRGGPGKACDWLQEWALGAIARGEKVDRFAFEDARYNRDGKQQSSKAIERANYNAKSILAGLGVEQDAASVGPDSRQGDSARGGQDVVGDVQGHEARNVRTGVPQLPENRKILPKAR